MGDRWEARLSAMESTQEKLEHNLREMEKQLAKLTSLFKDMIVYPRAHHPCHINRSLDHLCKLQAICHTELIALTCGNQDLQLCLFS